MSRLAQLPPTKVPHGTVAQQIFRNLEISLGCERMHTQPLQERWRWMMATTHMQQSEAQTSRHCPGTMPRRRR
jgi:hypothetical protein